MSQEDDRKRGSLTPGAWDALITTGGLPRRFLIDKDAKKPAADELLRIARDIDPSIGLLFANGAVIADTAKA